MKYILVTGAYGGMGRKTVAALDKTIDVAEENVIPLQVVITDADR